MLPVVAAFSGAFTPALVYTFFNYGSEGMAGWGIPMATDIAFVLGVLTLLGKRVPAALYVFVLAFAIIDDLIAILVIALFYTEGFNFAAFGLGIGTLLLAFVLQRSKAYSSLLFLAFGIIVWFSFLNAGIHATMAGVAMAIVIPSKGRIRKNEYFDKVQRSLSIYRNLNGNGEERKQQQLMVSQIEQLSVIVESPMARLQRILHPVSSFLILPVFAFANAGIVIDGETFRSLLHPISIGIIFGLFLGKPLGIVLFVWICTRLKITQLPKDTSWIDLLGVAFLGGMGFTMSLFISILAFKDMQLLNLAKAGILSGSLIAVLTGAMFFLLRRKT
jgi:Na+:H+ antiporter, NhaA family